MTGSLHVHQFGDYSLCWGLAVTWEVKHGRGRERRKGEEKRGRKKGKEEKEKEGKGDLLTEIKNNDKK